MDLTKFSKQLQPLLQQILIVQDRKGYIQQLPEGKDKDILILLISKISHNFDQECKRLGIPLQLQKQLKLQKIIEILKDRNLQLKKKTEIMTMIKDIFNDLKFIYTKPIDLSNQNNNNTMQIQQDNNNIISSEIYFENNFNKMLKQKINQKNSHFGMFTQYGIRKLSQQILLQLSYDNKINFLHRQNILKAYSDNFIIKFIKKTIHQAKQNGKFKSIHQFLSDILSHLNKSQINCLKNEIPDILNDKKFIKIWFYQNYGQKINYVKQISQLNLLQKQNKRKIFEIILKELKTINTGFIKEYQEQLFKEILILDLFINDPKLDLFVEYLTKLRKTSTLLEKEYNERIERKQSHNDKYYGTVDLYLQNRNWNEDRIINKYLIGLFKKQNSKKIIQTLKFYIAEKVLLKTEAKVKLSQGQQVKNLINCMSDSQINEIKELKQMTFQRQKNKLKFDVNQQIILNVKIKNIRKIMVKIYEIDLQKYYLQNFKQIDQTINLNYLKPMICYQYQVSNINPFKQQYHQLFIDKIQKKRGLFIVELHGAGLTSRAIIRKGSIISFSHEISAGIQLSFYNEEGKSIQEIKLWVNGRCQVIKGKYVIPYGKNQNQQQIIAVYENYAELLSVNIPQENYQLNVGYVYNSESFIVGQRAKIIIHAQLKIQEMNVPLKILKNTKISIQLTNNMNIKSQLSFQNIQWSENNDYILQFPVQNFLHRIEINLTTQIKLLTGQLINLENKKQIIINKKQNESQNFINIYLQKYQQIAKLFIVGINGQAISNVNVKIIYQYIGFIKSLEIQLITNIKGQIILNNLSLIRTITAEIEIFDQIISKTWSLQDQFGLMQYLSQVYYYRQNQSISLPLPTSIKQKNDLIFYKNQFKTIQNYIDFVCIDNGRIDLQNLTKGTYQLELLPLNITTTIIVKQGKQWDQVNQIYDETTNKVYQIKRNNHAFITLGKLQQNNNNSNEASIDLIFPKGVQNYQSLRAHILLMNYNEHQLKQLFEPENFTSKIETEIKTLKKYNCNFYNNKILSDQSSYVINRLNETKFIGNNFQKPRLFLQKILIQNTTQTKQMLSAQQDYQKTALSKSMMKARLSGRGKGGKSGKSGGGDRMACKRLGAHKICRKTSFNNKLNSHNNFLLNSSKLIQNIIPKNGKLTFLLPQGYHSIQVFLFSSNSATNKAFNLNTQTQINKKDIRHKGLKSDTENCGLTIARSIHHLYAGDQLKITQNNIWSVVSLNRIISYAKTKGIILPEWVIKWRTYSQKQKNEVYTKQICHQLNVYIRQNDPQYFQKIVKKFISNKVTKTYVDYCLLNDPLCFIQAEIGDLSSLNEFQKIILIKQLMNSEKTEQAHQISLSMMLKNKCFKKNYQEFKQKFDSIIMAKLIQDQGQNFSKQKSSGVKKPHRFRPGGSRSRQRDKKKRKIVSSSDSSSSSSSSQSSSDNNKSDQQIDNLRSKYKPGFRQMQSTKQYAEVTYSDLKNQKQSKNLVKPSSFWAQLAVHKASGTCKQFISQSFMYLQTKTDFLLACCFLPNQPNPLYQLNNDSLETSIKAKSTFLLFIKELCALPFIKEYEIMIRQRFFSSKDRYIYQGNGNQVEKEVDQFITKNVYVLQTNVTNISSRNIQLQLLVDLPQGSIPILSQDYTEIQNFTISSYSTEQFEYYFYFPFQGTFSMYPSNLCREQTIICQADKIDPIKVKSRKTVHKLQTFTDVIKSGTQKDILEYLSSKNIFDEKYFTPDSILWMLTDKQFFKKTITILKKRYFYNSKIWSFGIYHNDQECINRYIENKNLLQYNELPILQYYPYYSTRTHKFMNEKKSTIRNIELKKTYLTFIIRSLIKNDQSLRFKMVMIYYLLLQDRIEISQKLFLTLSQNQKESHRLQCDYLECFLDMYKSYPNFTRARKLSSLYIEYPILEWRKLFIEISQTLNKFDKNDIIEEQEETKKQILYQTQIIDSKNQLTISIPSNTMVQVKFYEINLQLYFSEYPFSDIKSFSYLKPTKKIIFECKQFRTEKVLRQQIADNMKDFTVQICQFKKQLPPNKVKQFLWINPCIKIKINQQEGFIQVFFNNKQIPGAYCKVYSKNQNQIKFYRDGYTDIIGCFKYALAQIKGIQKFAILTILDQGGVINTIQAPQQTGFYEQ